MESTHTVPPADAPLDGARIRVSVVVPVYRPGDAIDELVASLDAQTLPHDRFEVLLCDDGSGEETLAQLDGIAAGRPNVRVIPLARTGWPGTPRNHGIDVAAGRYLQFVDQDDHLFPEALERLCDYADEHGSDVVVGREVGIGRDIPHRIFREDVPDARLGTDPLLQMLTPHKMFRTAFLREHAIRFPDGRVRLEDHLFVMRAYFEADVISILASTPCYAWVNQEGSASSARIEPETYFPHLEAVLDLVESCTEPGQLRDRLLRHWLRGKILQRLAGRQMLRYPDDYRTRLLDVVTPLVERRFGPGVDAGLSYANRLRVALLRAGRRDELLALARFETSLDGQVEVAHARWSAGGGLHLELRVLPAARDGDAADDWNAPAWLAALHASVTGAPPTDRIEVRVHGDAAPRRVARSELSADGRAHVALDPLRVFEVHDDAREAPLDVRVRVAGWTFEAPLVLDADRMLAAGPSPVLAGRPCTLAPGRDGGAVLRRAWPRGRMRDATGRAARRLRRRLRRAR